MEETVTYRGFLITVRTEPSNGAEAYGAYTVSAIEPTATAALQRANIRGFSTRTVMTLGSTGTPHMLALRHIADMARREIDYFVSQDRWDHPPVIPVQPTQG